jgi:hypothetical protein
MDVTLPFVCPRCSAQSWNPNDAEHRYCGRCHRFVDDPHPSSFAPSIEAAKEEESPAPAAKRE